MAPTTEAPKNGAAEAAKKTQETVRHYMDESAAIGRSYFSAVSTTTQASLRAAFDFQNAGIQAWRVMLDPIIPAEYNWMEQTAQSVRKAQDATLKLVAAGFNMVEASMPGMRG